VELALSFEAAAVIAGVGYESVAAISHGWEYEFGLA
jgi:hypothetical protein